MKLASAFLEEYQKIRHLVRSEIKLAPVIATAGHIEDFSFEYWLLTKGSNRASVKTVKYYSNCAQWFHRSESFINENLARAIKRMMSQTFPGGRS